MKCFNLDTETFTGQSVPEGAYAFGDNEASSGAKMEQVVSVTAGTTYQFLGQYGTDGNSNTDAVEARVRYRDSSGTTISGGEVTLTGLRSDTTTEFDTFEATTTAPSGAVQAVVSIDLTQVDGTAYSDAFVDALSFAEAPEDVAAAADGPFTVEITDTLSPGTTLLENNGNGSDSLGPSGDADIASFGGGDLGGSVADNAAGTTAALAGGSLQVNADGSLSLSGPTTGGTYRFDYRLSDGSTSDTATVWIHVVDESILNPSCEVGSGNSDLPSTWTDVSSSGSDSVGCLDLSTADYTTQTAPDGSYVFGDNTADGTDKVIRQRVPVLAGQGYRLAARVGTDDANSVSDEATLRVTYLASDGAIIAGSGGELTGLRSDTDSAFDRYTLESTSPSTADRARISVRFENVDRTNYSEVFVDDLSFERVQVAPVARDDGPFSTTVGETLVPSATLFDDNGDGPDLLGSPAATVVSYGGGDLGGSVDDVAAGSTAALAGGTLQVNSDGTFSLSNPRTSGTYTFDYRLANATRSDVATVEVVVRGSSLLTPSCEYDDNGVPPGWTDPSGNDTVGCIDLSGLSTSQTAPDGSQVFGDTTEDGTSKTLRQDVLVEAGQPYRLALRYATDDALSTTDEGTVRLRYLDDSGAVIAGSGVEQTGLRSDTDSAFDSLSVTTTAPSTAAEARVELGFDNVDNTNYTEAFFDNVTFVLAAVPPRAADDGPLVVPASGTLGPVSLYDDNGAGADALGTPTATVVSYGGGDLGGTVTDTAAGTTVPLAGGDLTVSTDGTLTLQNVTTAGTYTFDYRLSNSAGTDTATVTLVVEPAAAVVGGGTTIDDGDATPSPADGTDFGRVPVEDGRNATFAVENRGPVPLVLNGTPAVQVTGPDADAYVVATQPNATVPAGGSRSFTLSFTPTSEGPRSATVSIPTNDPTEGTYTFAVAATGVDALSATTGPAANVTGESATVAGTVDPGGDVVNASVAYSPSGSPGSAVTVPTDPATVSGIDDVAVSATLTGLAPNASYTYRLLATNGSTTVDGGTASVTTPAVAPTVTTDPVSNVTSSGATLRGTVAPGGDETTVTFEYAPVTRPNATTTVVADGSPLSGTGDRRVSATVALDPETNYTVRVVASNDVGSDSGAERTVRTLGNPPVVGDTGPLGVDETAPNGTVVGDVNASDGEGGRVDDNVSYVIAADGSPDPDGDGTAALTVDVATGVVTVADADDLDHEAAPTVALPVTVVDDTGRSTNTTVNVSVRDVAPTIANQSLGSVSDAAANGTVVGTVTTGGDGSSVTLTLGGDNPNPDGDATPALAVNATTGVVSIADAGDLDAGTAMLFAVTTSATDGTTTASATATVSVFDGTPPTVDVGSNRTVELGESVTLDAGTATDNVGVDTIEWDVDADGTVDAVGSSFPYRPTTTGTATVRVRVTDAAGNVATDTVAVTAVDTTAPSVGTLPNRSVDEDAPVTLVAPPTTDAGVVATYTWAFGDGTTATGRNVSHAYADPGSYTVTLTVTDGANNTVTATATVSVADTTPPTARLAANRTAVLVGDPIRVDADNATDNVGVTAYNWSLGDGTTATGPTVTHAFAAPGTYPVTVTVSDAAGFESTATTNVRVDTPATLSVGFVNTTTRTTAGDVVNATVRVENTGTLSGTDTVSLTANGTVVATRPVTVAGGATETVTLTWRTGDGDAGTYALSAAAADGTTATTPSVTVVPLRTDLSLQRAPTAVSSGDVAVFAVDVTNPGVSTVTRQMMLVEGAVTIDRQPVTLGPGETTRVTLRWNTSGATAGDHPMAVTTGNVTASAPMVVVPPTPFPNGLPGSRQYTPQDVDADPRFEDIDGSGTVDFLDVITLVFADFEAINADPAQRGALDFDEDGNVDFVDVIDLVFQL